MRAGGGEGAQDRLGPLSFGVAIQHGGLELEKAVDLNPGRPRAGRVRGIPPQYRRVIRVQGAK